MVRRARVAQLVLAVLAATCGETAEAVTQNATINATVVKPLTLAAEQNLDLGTIILGPGTWSAAKVAISRNGIFTCSAPLTCTGAPQVAIYKVTGTNKMSVQINAPDVMLVNQADPTQKLTLLVDSPGQITLPSSGTQGTTFSLGGSIALSSTTTSGTYSGTFQVTVDYQ